MNKTIFKDRTGKTIKEYDIVYLKNFNSFSEVTDECRIVLYRDGYILRSLNDDSFCNLDTINPDLTLILDDSKESFVILRECIKKNMKIDLI